MLTHKYESSEIVFAKASNGAEVTLPYRPVRAGGYWAVVFFEEVILMDTEWTGGQASAEADALNEAYMNGFEAALLING